MQVPYAKMWYPKYYENVAAHLRDGAELIVTAQSAANVINILCTAERSSAQGGAPLPLA